MSLTCSGSLPGASRKVAGTVGEIGAWPSRRSPPSKEPAGGHSRGTNPSNCSHFCSHLADFAPTNPVRTWVYESTTASLLSSRSLVRIQQGAFNSILFPHPPGCRDAAGRCDGAKSSERLSSLAEDRQVGVIGEQTIALAAGDFPGDAEFHQDLEGLAGGGETQSAQLLELLGAGERPPA